MLEATPGTNGGTLGHKRLSTRWSRHRCAVPRRRDRRLCSWGDSMVEGTRRLVPPLYSGDLSELRSWARSWMAVHLINPVDPNDVLSSMGELVTNSILYGSGPIDVELRLDRGHLHLGVTDCSDDMPVQGSPSPSAENGRGMMVVASLSTAWGARRLPHGGKTVWCEFAI